MIVVVPADVLVVVVTRIAAVRKMMMENMIMVLK